MNLEPVSAENRNDQRQRYRTGKDKSTRSSSHRSNSDQNLFTPNPLIDRILCRISEQKLLAAEHVRAHLLDHHRRNCRPSTIRSNGASVTGFLRFLKDSGINQLLTDSVMLVRGINTDGIYGRSNLGNTIFSNIEFPHNKPHHRSIF